ncbi:Bor family protein, partial [Escherichia coli]|nr:Bor family protein [Escherichia coli]
HWSTSKTPSYTKSVSWHHYPFTVGNKPTAVTPKETITHHFFVSGIGQEKTVDAAKICGGAENVVKTETQQTFVNGFLGFITLGIYTPLEA